MQNEDMSISEIDVFFSLITFTCHFFHDFFSIDVHVSVLTDHRQVCLLCHAQVIEPFIQRYRPTVVFILLLNRPYAKFIKIVKISWIHVMYHEV
jgi:hypothetical protein